MIYSFLREMNRDAKDVGFILKKLNDICRKSLNGMEVTIPKDAQWPLDKYQGRKGILHHCHVSTNSFVILGLVRIYRLKAKYRYTMDRGVVKDGKVVYNQKIRREKVDSKFIEDKSLRHLVVIKEEFFWSDVDVPNYKKDKKLSRYEAMNDR